jgi:glycine C-acetyltransferase
VAKHVGAQVGLDCTRVVLGAELEKIGDAALACRMADRLLERGIYVIGFSFPVVPQGQARVRCQVSAGHTREHLEMAIAAFTKVGRTLGVLR